MRRALDRWAAYVLLGAGGLLVAVSALFSSGSSNGRLVWIGLAALVVAAAVGAWAFLGTAHAAQIHVEPVVPLVTVGANSEPVHINVNPSHFTQPGAYLVQRN